MSLVHPGSELPTLPDVLDNESDSDLSSFTGTLVRLGDAAGKTPAVRDQLVADGVLVRIVQLLRQRSEWLLRISVSVGSSNEHGRGIDVLSQCLRVCGNSCIDCNSARDALLQHAALPAILACLRCTTRVDVVKFAAGALSNLICAHEAAQEALMHNNATAVIVPALNHAIARIRSGQAQNEDFMLCKLLLRLYINLAASTPNTPPHVTHSRHSHILSHPLLPTLVALGRLFVIPISDQPDPDDHSLVVDIVTLCRALYPPLVVGSEHSELISLVIDASKRQDERLQQLSLSTLCEWARCSPRVLPFLSSRLHSSFPSLQLTALDVWLQLTSDCEDGEVLEAALDAIPRFVSLAASKRTDVADRAMTVLLNVAAYKEAREQMWRTEGFVKRIRLQLTGQTSPVTVVRLLRCFSLSPELAEPMRKEGLVDDVLHLLLNTQQRTHQERQQVEEQAQLRRDVEQQQTDSASVDIRLQCGLYRYLRNLVSVKLETDGKDDDLSNERWDSRQWTITQSNVHSSVFVTQSGIASHIIASPSFIHMLDAPPPSGPLAMDAARLLAALIVSFGIGRSGSGEKDVRVGQAAVETRWMAVAPTVLPLLACLARSDRYEDQFATVSAYRWVIEAQMPQLKDAASDIRQYLLSELERSDSVHVVSVVVAVLTAMRRQSATWQWQGSERLVIANACDRWAARAQSQQAEENADDPSDEFTMICQIRWTMQQLTNEDDNHTNTSVTETLTTT